MIQISKQRATENGVFYYPTGVLYMVHLKTKKKKLLTLTDKRQTQPLVREGAQQRQHSDIQTELISVRKSQGGLDAKKCWLTDH
jgi:hypothetical protein